MTPPEHPLRIRNTEDRPDVAALEDARAGRLIDSDQVARHLGGWSLATLETATPLPAATTDFTVIAGGATTPLAWTHSAFAECDRLRTIVARVSDTAERRFAAAILTAMIRLIVDGHHGAEGISTLPIHPMLSLRLLSGDGRLIVLGLSPTDAIT